MNVTEIRLTPWEMLLAAQCGVMRQVENIKLGRNPYYGSGNGNDWQLHIEGALGEYALSKHLGLHWSGKGTLRSPDVIGYIEARTRSKHHYDLILHDDDIDDRQYWLLTGINGVYRVHGYMLGKDGKQDKFWSDPAGGRPAYFIPQTELQDDLRMAQS